MDDANAAFRRAIARLDESARVARIGNDHVAVGHDAIIGALHAAFFAIGAMIGRDEGFLCPPGGELGAPGRARLLAWMRSTPSSSTSFAMLRAFQRMCSGFFVAAGKGMNSPPASVIEASEPAAFGQHKGAAAGAHDGARDLDRGQLRTARVELGDDLQYGRALLGQDWLRTDGGVS